MAPPMVNRVNKSIFSSNFVTRNILMDLKLFGVKRRQRDLFTIHLLHSIFVYIQTDRFSKKQVFLTKETVGCRIEEN